MILKHLKITRPPNTYILLISYRSPNRQLAADVANEIALSYLAHTYRIRYQGHRQPQRFHGAAIGRAEGQDGEIQRRRGPV